MKFDKVVLNKSKLSLQNIATKRQLNNFGIELIEIAGGDVIVRMEKICLSGKEKIIKEMQYPRDWWQAFRERWLPKWWLRLYPVQYKKVVTREIIKMCPHLAVPDGKPHVMFLLESE